MHDQLSLARPSPVRSKSCSALDSLGNGIQHIRLRPAHEHHKHLSRRKKLYREDDTHTALSQDYHTESPHEEEDYITDSYGEESTTNLSSSPSPSSTFSSAYITAPTSPLSEPHEQAPYNSDLDEWPDTSHDETNTEKPDHPPKDNNTPWQDNPHRDSNTKLTTPDTFPLRTSYIPFPYQSALSNHLPLSHLLSPLTTPLFLHSTLQLPSLLSQTLSLPVPHLLPSLTPSTLLSYTTTVNPLTLLPSLCPSFPTDKVHGLCIFNLNETQVQLIDDWYTDSEKTEVEVEIESQQGEPVTCRAWAWFGDRQDGCKEVWDLESFVAGRVYGLAGVKW